MPNKIDNQTKELIITEYRENKTRMVDLARKYGFSTSTIGYVLNRAGFTRTGNPNGGLTLEALRASANRCHSYEEMAKELNTTEKTISKWMDYYKVEIRDRRHKTYKKKGGPYKGYVLLKQGYVLVDIEACRYRELNDNYGTNTPHCYVAAHRWIIEKGLIGYTIGSKYNIHHKDYDPVNNQPDNLKILKVGNHARLHEIRNLYLEAKKEGNQENIDKYKRHLEILESFVEDEHRYNRAYLLKKKFLEDRNYQAPSNQQLYNCYAEYLGWMKERYRITGEDLTGGLLDLR